MSIKQRNGEKGRVTILSFHGKDAYSQSLIPALREAGAEVMEGVFSGRWLAAKRRDFDCVHINWPSFLYSVVNTSKLSIVRNFARFIALILMLKLWGVPVYWIAHNLYPHEPCIVPGLDWLARRFIIAISRNVFVHGPTAASILIEEFPSVRRKVVLIDHGHWVDFYPRDCGREDARKRLGLREDEFVFLFIGLCREYKNLHGLLQAFEKIQENAKLVIAGSFLSEAYYQRIRALAERHTPGRVVLRAGYIPDVEMQYFLTSANAVVLPYIEILTSGAAVLALSFGRPVVAPQRGHLIDLVSSDCGILYKIGDEEGLLSAMRQVMNQQFEEEWIVTRILKYDWGKTARRIVEVIRGR